MGTTAVKYEDIFRKGDVKWEELLKLAIEAYMAQNKPEDAGLFYEEHVRDILERVVKAFAEYCKGCSEDPAKYLKKTFINSAYDEMIYMPSIWLVSMCMHYLALIVGKIHFAYIPDGSIVGLSKISCFIEALARRPQVQEKLTEDIVN